MNTDSKPRLPEADRVDASLDPAYSPVAVKKIQDDAYRAGYQAALKKVKSAIR